MATILNNLESEACELVGRIVETCAEVWGKNISPLDMDHMQNLFAPKIASYVRRQIDTSKKRQWAIEQAVMLGAPYVIDKAQEIMDFIMECNNEGTLFKRSSK